MTCLMALFSVLIRTSLARTVLMVLLVRFSFWWFHYCGGTEGDREGGGCGAGYRWGKRKGNET